MSTFPRVVSVRQRFPTSPAVDVEAAIARGWSFAIAPGAEIAVAVGSRGISRLGEVVRAVVARVRAAGARPFLVPAMGSHGGATAEGQAAVLAGYGLDESSLGAPVRASMDVVRLGETEDGVPVHLAAEAARADGVIVVGRVKPHTRLRGPVESGVIKMIAVGLGKREGAAAFHAAEGRVGFPRLVETMARAKLATGRFLGGVALVEDERHALARLEVVPADELFAREPALLVEAWSRLPRLPFREIDLLVVDALGKDVSGLGMDPNVVGRGAAPTGRGPVVHRLFVREPTAATHGNVLGVGLADFTTTRLARALDREATYANALTALNFAAPKIPIHFDTDREVLTRALATLPDVDPARVRLVRIRDTLSVGTIHASPACLGDLDGKLDVPVDVVGPPRELAFDGDHNLTPFEA